MGWGSLPVDSIVRRQGAEIRQAVEGLRPLTRRREAARNQGHRLRLRIVVCQVFQPDGPGPATGVCEINAHQNPINS